MSDDSREVISNILNWDEELQTFLQSKGTKDLAASVPLMPLIRFISAVDPMWRSSVEVIEARLVEGTLIRRYETERTHVDGIPGGEVASLRAHFGTSNTFSACRELEKPQLLFEKLWGYANHLGLYSEIGPSGQHLSNFPQACKHLAPAWRQGSWKNPAPGVIAAETSNPASPSTNSWLTKSGE
jgi:GH15 family glucan-1,4-alpha-glucosidase